MQDFEKESKTINGIKLIKPKGGRRVGAGRPMGVPNKLTRDVKALAADYGPEALQTLVWIMDHAESDQARVAAAREVLDRACGKPRQEIDVNDNKVTVHIHREQAKPSVDITPKPPLPLLTGGGETAERRA